ncbi:MAG: hypothetical protein K6G45_06255 [Lachnospiraceae bacterium]|nr:hypothetical protein [Lachnospiraceae bacterium]MCR5768077.1 hypothetical protein [Lachnospiraceae bacterium]
MAGDINKIDTTRLVGAASEIAQVRKTISSGVDAVNAVFRKMLESNAGESADELGAVAGQLKKSASDILGVMANYENVLKELAGIYDNTEKSTSTEASKLKFGGLR